MEKIFKLLRSPNLEDLNVGIVLLLRKDIGYIQEFFDRYGDRHSTIKDIDLKQTISDINQIYIQIAPETYICSINRILRLRNQTDKKGMARKWKIISKENYLNGMY